MIIEAENFIKRIKNYEITRPIVMHDDNDFIKMLYKKKLNECYYFLKYLNWRKDSLNLDEEKQLIQEIQNQIVNDYKHWIETNA